MIKILANDGISETGVEILEKEGYEVQLTHIAQEKLIHTINEEKIDVLLVRSATKVREDIINACPSLKIIGRGGVGMDNIDVDYAKSKGLHVINTPNASSSSVAELVFAHLFSGVRFLYDANRAMPLEGDTKFGVLKKSYAKGSELRGKTLGIIGFGRIGCAVAKIAIGTGMNVIATDTYVKQATIALEFYNNQSVDFDIPTQPFETVLKHADFITLHVPSQNGVVLGEKEFQHMKDGVGIINAARGGTIDEMALIHAIDTNKVAFAGLDVFENEPHPNIKILMHPKISLTPHIGAATQEAQDRIGKELADQIIARLKG